MNIEKMKEYVKLQKELKQEGVFGFHIEGAFQVQTSLLKSLPNLKVKKLNKFVEYPYEIYAECDGFTVFNVVKEHELMEFPQLEEQIKIYLEEDVDLSGMGDDHATA